MAKRNMFVGMDVHARGSERAADRGRRSVPHSCTPRPADRASLGPSCFQKTPSSVIRTG